MFDEGKAREEIEAILNQKEYKVYQQKPGAIENAWNRLMDWLTERLDSLFPGFQHTEKAAGPLLAITILVLITIVGLLIFLVVRKVKRERDFKDQQPLHSQQELAWTYERHLAKSQEAEMLADYNEAARHLFLALLLFYHEKNWVEAKIWKTNWDYYEELRKKDAQKANRFYKLAHFFDEAAYGERNVNLNEFTAFQSELLALLPRQHEQAEE